MVAESFATKKDNKQYFVQHTKPAQVANKSCLRSEPCMFRTPTCDDAYWCCDLLDAF
jgi:hypothetical protein